MALRRYAKLLMYDNDDAGLRGDGGGAGAWGAVEAVEGFHDVLSHVQPVIDSRDYNDTLRKSIDIWMATLDGNTGA